MKHDIAKILPPYVRCVITEAHGRWGTYVLYTRNRKIFARIYFIPPNPRTRKQQQGREAFARAVNRWKRLDKNGKAPWNREAARFGRKGYHLFISVYAAEALRKSRRTPRRFVRVITPRGEYRGALSSVLPAVRAPALRTLRRSLRQAQGPPFDPGD